MQKRHRRGRAIPRASSHVWCALRWALLAGLCTCADLLPRAPALGRGPSPRQIVDDVEYVGGQFGGTRSKLRPLDSVRSVLQVLRSHSAEIRAPSEDASCGLRGLRGGSSGAAQGHADGRESREFPGVAEPWRVLQGASDEPLDPNFAVAPGWIPSHLKLAEPLSALQQPLEAAPTHRPPGSNPGGHIRPGYPAGPGGPFQFPQPGQYPQDHHSPFRQQPTFHPSAANRNIGGYGGGGAHPHAPVPGHPGLEPPSYPVWEQPVVPPPAPSVPSVKSMHVTVPDGVAAGMYMTVNIPGRGATSVLVPVGVTSGQILEVRYPVAVPQPQTVYRTVSVRVPPGVLPGERMQITVQGEALFVQVPPGALPGQLLDVRYVPIEHQPHSPRPVGRPAGRPPGYYSPHSPYRNQWTRRDASVGPPRSPGRPPVPRGPPYVLPPPSPPQPGQLMRRLVLSTRPSDGSSAGVLQRSREEARQLAAQYNASLYTITSQALEHAEAQPGSTRGRAASYASDPAMVLAWQLTAQVPPSFPPASFHLQHVPE
ncbi:hypothetical protein T484DRAFT_1880638 [Baffinella frigidus]|nr:hypothetical protein T484DRAFT_1880638 [Cryptophyta sp. CCMP2293]